MKIRNGFVSNSSSSSFIIAFKKEDVCPHCGRGSLNIIDAISNVSNYNDDNSVDFDNAKDIINYINENNCYSQSERARIISRIKRQEKEGWSIAQIGISNHDTYLNERLNEDEQAGIVQILYRENT